MAQFLILSPSGWRHLGHYRSWVGGGSFLHSFVLFFNFQYLSGRPSCAFFDIAHFDILNEIFKVRSVRRLPDVTYTYWDSMAFHSWSCIVHRSSNPGTARDQGWSRSDPPVTIKIYYLAGFGPALARGLNQNFKSILKTSETCTYDSELIDGPLLIIHEPHMAMDGKPMTF